MLPLPLRAWGQGDGSIGASDNTSFRITISFHQKDYHLALKIQSLFSGSIYKDKNRKIYTYYIGGKTNIMNLLPFIYDKLQHLEKRKRCFFYCAQLGIDVSQALKPWDFDIMSNHWLCGFIDGDGCFQIYLPKKQGGATIYLLIDLNIHSKYLLDAIQKAFQGGSISITLRKGVLKYNKDKISVKYRTNYKVFDQWCNYLNKFNLSSSKYKEFLIWKRAYLCRNKKKRSLIKDPKKLELLKNLLNKLKL